MEKVTTTLRISKELLEQLKKEAQNMDISFNAYVISILNKNHKD